MINMTGRLHKYQDIALAKNSYHLNFFYFTIPLVLNSILSVLILVVIS